MNPDHPAYDYWLEVLPLQHARPDLCREFLGTCRIMDHLLSQPGWSVNIRGSMDPGWLDRRPDDAHAALVWRRFRATRRGWT